MPFNKQACLDTWMQQPRVAQQVAAQFDEEDDEEVILICPITQQIMVDPVMAEDGASYEREAIETWFQRCRAQNRALTSPKTGSELRSAKLIRNFVLRDAIALWRKSREARASLSAQHVDLAEAVRLREQYLAEARASLEQKLAAEREFSSKLQRDVREREAEVGRLKAENTRLEGALRAAEAEASRRARTDAESLILKKTTVNTVAEKLAVEGCVLYARKAYGEALPLLQRASKMGHAEAQYFLGAIYFKGRCMQKNDAEAVCWYRKAADQGVAKAQYRLGYCYEYGRGDVEKDQHVALEWFRKAADQGLAKAQYMLGQLYEHRGGNYVEWYRKAADQGHAIAQYELAERYHNGVGVAKDERVALEWYRKAAKGVGGIRGALAQGNVKSLSERLGSAPKT